MSTPYSITLTKDSPSVFAVFVDGDYQGSIFAVSQGVVAYFYPDGYEDHSPSVEWFPNEVEALMWILEDYAVSENVCEHLFESYEEAVADGFSLNYDDFLYSEDEF